MKRILKLLVVLFVLIGALIFAGALAGGLMNDAAFTPEAKGVAH